MMKTKVAVRDKTPHRFQVVPLREVKARQPPPKQQTTSNPNSAALSKKNLKPTAVRNNDNTGSTKNRDIPSRVPTPHSRIRSKVCFFLSHNRVLTIRYCRRPLQAQTARPNLLCPSKPPQAPSSTPHALLFPPPSKNPYQTPRPHPAYSSQLSLNHACNLLPMHHPNQLPQAQCIAFALHSHLHRQRYQPN